MRIHLASWFKAGSVALLVAGCSPDVENVTFDGSGGSGGGGGGSGGGPSDAGIDVHGDECDKASDCPPPVGICYLPACLNGYCGKEPQNEFKGCDDGLECTENDACHMGECVGVMKVCETNEICHVGACDEATGMCKVVPGNDNFPCEDNDPCTGAGSCLNGACAKGQQVDCSVFDGACSVGVCHPVDGCVAQPGNEGNPCDDGLFCTVGDHCQAGACVPTGPNICAPPGGCYIGVCDEAAQSCASAPGNDGDPCDDFNACTTGTTCANGACINGAPTNEGGPCNDGSGCTTGEFCTAGVCGGGAGPTVYFADDFHDNSKGWQLDQEWQIGSATVSPAATYNPDPATDHTATNDNGVAGVMIGGNANTDVHPYRYLTSSAFNTASAAGPVILGFYRWLNSDYDPFMHDTIDVWNGATWVNVWTSGNSSIEDTSWTFIQHNITAHKNAGMRIRFGFDVGAAGVYSVSSWNIDDVLVASAACP